MREDLERIAALPPLPPRPHDGHKGLFGRVLVVGGAEDMLGAPVLAGTAALRMGSGLVQVAVPRAILPAALSVTPELIGLGLGRPSDQRKLLDAARAADALVIGPGLGTSAAAVARVRQLLRLDKPMVLDADALNVLALGKALPAIGGRAVLTPHPGEMRRLGKFIGLDAVPGDDDGRIDVAVALAQRCGQVVVLKGHRTVVTDGRRVYVNATGDSSLSKAGSGDVLSGMIGCLLGQAMAPLDAACLAVHLHGLAGESAGTRLGRRSALARDVIDELPAVLREADSAVARATSP